MVRVRLKRNDGRIPDRLGACASHIRTNLGLNTFAPVLSSSPRRRHHLLQHSHLRYSQLSCMPSDASAIAKGKQKKCGLWDVALDGIAW